MVVLSSSLLYWVYWKKKKTHQSWLERRRKIWPQKRRIFCLLHNFVIWIFRFEVTEDNSKSCFGDFVSKMAFSEELLAYFRLISIGFRLVFVRLRILMNFVSAVKNLFFNFVAILVHFIRILVLLSNLWLFYGVSWPNYIVRSASQITFTSVTSVNREILNWYAVPRFENTFMHDSPRDLWQQ